MRVATLLPSATDMVVALGREKDLVGVSHSCDLPKGMEALPRLTSTAVPVEQSSEDIDAFVRNHLSNRSALYELDLPALKVARPDVIISQGLCDVCAVSTGDVLEAVQSLAGAPALIDLNPNTLDDIRADVQRVGEALDCIDSAQSVEQDMLDRIGWVKQRSGRIPDTDRPTVAFLEWLTPLFNGGHWNPELVNLAGATEVFGSSGLPSSTRTLEQLAAADPDILLVACCGYRVPETLTDLHAMADTPGWNELSAVRNGRIFVADGQDYFARPGPNVVDAMERLAVTLHPTRFALLDVAPFQRFR